MNFAKLVPYIFAKVKYFMKTKARKITFSDSLGRKT